MAYIWEKRNTYRASVRKPEGTKPLGRPMCKWKGNIKKDIKEIGQEGMEWINLAQYRDEWWALVNMVMKLCFP
jgi:hypothetical protein